MQLYTQLNFNVGVVRRVLWFFLFFHGYTVAQIPSDYYTKKEEQVKRMAAEILKLDAARCDWAANCSSSTCSRHACTPIDGLDDPNKYNFTCQQQIEPNPYCSSSTRSCYSRRINNAMSYVRMAPTPTSNTSISPIPDEMCSTICMTRDFTSTMKALASENDHANDVHEIFYLGSVDGVHRFYPGEESHGCYNYDPRTRTWYNGAISLPTHLIVLIDNSSFSNDRTNSPLMDTALEYSKVIVKDLIYTPSADDMLDVIVFDQTNAIALSTSPVCPIILY
ncbi:hypothetical protein SUGI_0767310 [Cryptomeria japonica]|nr:hypothetical protein SUGI_0767310 [Cryptomeria japonica]